MKTYKGAAKYHSHSNKRSDTYITELSAHDQRNQWADNLKANSARVFRFAHDTHFDKLSSPVKFQSAIFYVNGVCYSFLTHAHGRVSFMVQELWQFSLTDFIFSTN